MTFILSDLSRKTNDGRLNNEILFEESLKWIADGRAVFVSPPDQYTTLNFTGLQGSSSGLYFSTVFQLRKWEFQVEKADENIEVSPVHQQYYQLTQKQKEDLEMRIKQGLGEAAQSVSDLELVEHDLRKYNEFIKYFGLAYNEKASMLEEKEKPDEYALKAMFIDQVDFFEGGGQAPGRLSMTFMQQQNIVPTIVQDFFDMKSEDDLIKSNRLKNIPTVEKNMLKTKWRAYENWKMQFRKQVSSRYIRFKTLERSKTKAVDEYRNWLKPIIARHKLIEEGLQNPSGAGRARTFFLRSQAQAVGINGIELWTWRYFKPSEFQKTPGELLSKGILNKKLEPYDTWTQKNIIFHPEHGLQTSYPWITRKMVDEWAAEIKQQWLDPSRALYYMFFVIGFDRSIIKPAGATEFDDVDVGIAASIMSQNILLAKLLEIKAKQKEIEIHIDEMLGIKHHGEDFEKTKDEKKGKNAKKGKADEAFEDIKEALDIEMLFSRHGPYESDFEDRITKFYLKQMGGGWYATITRFIKDKVGFGKVK